MKLIDELQGIEKDNALVGGKWPGTIESLSGLMRKRARDKGYGALCVGVHTRQVAAMIREWARDEGLEVREGQYMLTRTILLVWGNVPIVSSGCDAVVMADGSILINEK